MIRLIFFPQSLWLATQARRAPVLNSSWPILGRYAHHGASLPSAPKMVDIVTPEETATARLWISKFKGVSIPRESVELNFSRSSGPGGQHVNKVNTKVTIRCPVGSPWIPVWAQPYLRDGPHYVVSTDSILITSTISRSQAENIQDCLSKLHALILKASSAPIKNEPSAEQKKRVAALEKIEKARRRQEKSYRSEIKKGRASRDSSWD